jgi:hypothetical protein
LNIALGQQQELVVLADQRAELAEAKAEEETARAELAEVKAKEEMARADREVQSAKSKRSGIAGGTVSAAIG